VILFIRWGYGIKSQSKGIWAINKTALFVFIGDNSLLFHVSADLSVGRFNTPLRPGKYNTVMISILLGERCCCAGLD
jgi:hypothetical protein